MKLRAAILLVLALAVSLSCGKKKTEAELLTQINQLVEKEAYDEAVKALEEFVARFPQSPKYPEMLNKLATLYASSEKNYMRAVETYRQLIDKFPGSKYEAQAQFMIGYLYANEIKDLDMAKKEYEKFLEKYPNHELAASVKWELDHLGQDINEIDIFAKESSAAGKNNGSARK